MALFVLSLFPFDMSVGVGAFVIGLGQISSFLSLVQKAVKKTRQKVDFGMEPKITTLLSTCF